MIGFFIFAIGFSLLLTVLIRVAGLRVRRDVTQARASLLTFGFVVLVIGGWWFLTRGDRIEDRVLSPLILPSPMEVLRAFPRLHFEQELVRSALRSFDRVTIGFTLAAIV